jgi:hypothetical protein
MSDELARAEFMWFVIVNRLSPDPEDSASFGPWPTREEAQDFVESATDDPDEEAPHLWLDDVEFAEVLYINRVA